jgi:hypothetical protein
MYVCGLGAHISHSVPQGRVRIEQAKLLLGGAKVKQSPSFFPLSHSLTLSSLCLCLCLCLYPFS